MNIWHGSIRSGKGGRVPDRNAPDYNPDNETKVLTPTGFKLMGDLKIGDAVNNPDGTTANIIGIYDNGPKQFYRVTMRDGATVEADEDHLWAVAIAGQRPNRKHPRPPLPAGLTPADEWNLRAMNRCRIVNTRELCDLVARANNDRATGRTMPRTVMVPLTAPTMARGGNNQHETLSPYTIGALLGDGNMTHRAVTLTSVDQPIIDRIAAELPSHLHLVRTNADDETRAPSYRITRKTGDGHPATHYTTKEGIHGKKSHEKTAPSRMERLPVHDRRAFIQGLMDTDGYIDSDGRAAEYVTTSPQLARTAQNILRSLGYTAKLTTKETHYTYNGQRHTGRTAYRLHIQGRNLADLFHLPRKKERATPFNNGRNNGDVYHTIESVTPTVVDNSRCIAVNHLNHLYVTDDYIVTHNTFSSTLRWLIFLTNPPAGGQLAMIGRTRDSIARNVIDPLQDPEIYGPDIADQVQYTSGAPFATILGRRVYVLGASDSKAEKTIRGLTLAGAYVDEATVLHEDFFTQLTGRMSIPKAQLFATTNPDSPAHWLKKKYIDKIGPDPEKGQLHNWKIWHFNIDDNPVLSESYKNSIKNEFSGLFYKRFILGQWVAAAGAVYDMWNPEIHTVTDQEMPPMQQYLSIGIDYGTTNPTAAILLGLGEDNVLYALDEYRYTPSDRTTRKTDAQLSTDINNWREARRVTDIPVIVDPAAASFRVQMQSDGVLTHPANNDVLYGIRTITSLLATGKLKINTKCAGLLDEFPGYVWDTKATDEGKDEVVKKDDHCIRKGTLVTTERGDIPIEQVTTNDKVLTRAGYKRVLRAWQTSPSAPVLTVTTTSGHTVTGTGNHEIWTENRGWVQLDALRYGDKVATCEPSKRSSITESPIAATQTPTGTANAPTSPRTEPNAQTGASDYTKKSGKSTTTETSPPATTSTTSTATPQTTTRPTSKPYPDTNTTNTTRNSAGMTPSGSSAGSNGNTPGNKRPENGTHPKTAENGTPNTPNKHGSTAKNRPEHANNAETSTTHEQPTKKNVSAPASANRHGDATVESTTKHEHVHGAETTSSPTSTAKPKHATAVVLGIYDEPSEAPVYDLTVEDQHEFYAGGILVHNCLDALRYAVVTTERRWRNHVQLTAT